MTTKLSAGLLVLFIALLLQFVSSRAGVAVDFTLAAFVTAALLFSFWEVLIIILAGIFILNWQPAATPEMIFFALYPLAVHFIHPILQWHLWLKNLAGIALGNGALYLLFAATHFPWGVFLIDTLLCLLFGAAAFALRSLWESA